MAVTEDSPNRQATLQARIDDAKKRLEDTKHMEWAEIGTILQDLSDEMEGVEDHPSEKREEIYGRAQKKLDDVDEKLGGA